MSCCNNYQQNGINQLSNAIASLKCDPCPIRLYPCYKGLTLRICITSLVLQGSNLIVNFSIEKCGKGCIDICEYYITSTCSCGKRICYGSQGYCNPYKVNSSLTIPLSQISSFNGTYQIMVAGRIARKRCKRNDKFVYACSSICLNGSGYEPSIILTGTASPFTAQVNVISNSTSSGSNQSFVVYIPTTIDITSIPSNPTLYTIDETNRTITFVPTAYPYTQSFTFDTVAGFTGPLNLNGVFLFNGSSSNCCTSNWNNCGGCNNNWNNCCSNRCNNRCRGWNNNCCNTNWNNCCSTTSNNNVRYVVSNTVVVTAIP